MVDNGKVIYFYENKHDESVRLRQGIFKLEYARTIDIINRFIPPSPATIYDIGGGPGIYANYYAKKNYRVTLIDLVPKHIFLANCKLSQCEKCSAIIGDSRSIPTLDSSSADIIFLMGPLYHLVNEKDRLLSLKEAYRLLKPEGLLITTYISRFSPILIEGFSRDLFKNSNGITNYIQEIFSTGICSEDNILLPNAYFHSIEQIIRELKEVNFIHEKSFPVESIACTLKDFDDLWANSIKRKELMKILRILEDDKFSINATSHILTVSYKSVN